MSPSVIRVQSLQVHWQKTRRRLIDRSMSAGPLDRRDPCRARTMESAADEPSTSLKVGATEPTWTGQWRLLKYL